MTTWFRQSINRFGHVSDELLARSMNGELSAYRTLRLNAHLGKCWQCKARLEALQQASFQVVEYRRQQLERHLPLSSRRRHDFLHRLDEVWNESAAPVAVSWNPNIFRIARTSMLSPFLASTFVVVTASALLFFIWHQHARPSATLSSRAFLTRAEQAEAQQQATVPIGVVYQKIKVRVGGHTVDRALYRDITRRRRPLQMEAAPADQALARELARGGVDWEEPLRARDFRAWHDLQETVRDDVRSSADGLLTLTSVAPTGPIASESLTVRLADFHPVRRTIAVRNADQVNADQIEFAELHYDVLAWDAVNESLFEPLASPHVASAASRSLPVLASPGQLDLAELQARLSLNRLGADATEQLSFVRTQNSVEVHGIVESASRKEQLAYALRDIPHVTATFTSMTDMAAAVPSPHAESAPTPRVYSASAPESPLEAYLITNHRADEISTLSEDLLSLSLTVKQEANALNELDQRFGNNAELDTEGRVVRDRLVHSHAERLLSAAKAEDALLVKKLDLSTTEAPLTSATETSLADEAAKSFDLCRELIAGDRTSARPAATIAIELVQSTRKLQATAEHANAKN